MENGFTNSKNNGNANKSGIKGKGTEQKPIRASGRRSYKFLKNDENACLAKRKKKTNTGTFTEFFNIFTKNNGRKRSWKT